MASTVLFGARARGSARLRRLRYGGGGGSGGGGFSRRGEREFALGEMQLRLEQRGALLCEPSLLGLWRWYGDGGGGRRA